FMGIALHGISKTYENGFRALTDININFEQNQIYTIVGPSGCGKTTLLNIISGLLAPTSGTITINGRDVTDLPAEKRNIGMVFQSYALFPHLSVVENTEFGLRVRNIPPKQRRAIAEEKLGLVGLEQLADRKISQLSGGQRQRVALARALAIEPQILLLDEPLSALDPQLRRQVRDELKKMLARIAITTVMVTHDQEEALSVGNYCIVMNNGQIGQIARPEELYYYPQSAFVANFIGSSNIWRAKVTSISDLHYQLDFGFCTALLVKDRKSNHAALLSNSEVLAVIRPEDLDVTGEAAASCFYIKPQNITFLGDRILVEAETETKVAVVLVNTKKNLERLVGDDSWRISLNTDRMHFIPA
ncbi:MAG TPA: ABC transporter ATP-binding protein, partial [Negativicutes bacterium]|nr:ABC transporter ATP-binding protein [Negativicutes bacterium]